MVAGSLISKGVRVFYDRFEQVDLWGKNLYEHLADVYAKQARYTVMFISRHYAEKVWTSHERRAAQARAIRESEEYILPVRFDGTEIPGVLDTTAYLDLRILSPEELALAVAKKIGIDNAHLKLSSIPPLSSLSEEGEVAFDYTNHNGAFRLGDGLFEFETRWSEGGAGCIHCYNDGQSVAGIGIARSAKEIYEVTNARDCDMTSRSRLVEAGQIVVIKNINGLFAALKIIDVRHRRAGHDRDELRFRYRILRDGGADFSDTVVAM